MIYICEKMKKRGQHVLEFLVGRRRKIAEKEIFFQENFQHALEKGEGERSILLGDSGFVLRRSTEGRTGSTHPHLI